MKHETLKNAVAEAERFLKAAKAIRSEKSAYRGDILYLEGPKERGACLRASMDLTRALADLRRSS
jgi:uncharacterized protein (DUF1778 family)